MNIQKTPQAVKDIAESIIEERKLEELSRIQMEKLKLERLNPELELAKLQAEAKSDSISSESKTKSELLDTIIRSICTLTVKVPTKPEDWAFFFSSMDRAYGLKNVNENYKAEILLNLMGKKANYIITYLSDDDLIDYD